MVQRVITVLCVGVMSVFMASCGQSYSLQSITVAPSSPNIEGIGNTQALTVTAHFSNTKTEDVTGKSTFEIGGSSNPRAPLDAVTVSKAGILQAVISPTTGVAACTWHATPTGTSSSTSSNTTFEYSTDPYPVTITYSGFTATAYLSVAAASSCYDGITYKAPSGFAGN